LSPDNLDHVNRMGLAVAVDTRDQITDTRSGWRNELKLAREIKLFDSSTNFTQVDLDLRRYQRLPLSERHTLGLFLLTSVRTGRVGEGVAPWQQFGIGGTNTVRGWEFAARKGKNQFLAFTEYSYTLLEPRLINLPFGIKYRGGVQATLFGDLGCTWDEGPQFAAGNFIGGGGVGVRLLLPIISMVRFDVGWGQNKGVVRLHIGSWEKAEMARKRVR
jgi:outer membrane protein assembly factor BamA